jgi:hypothetical protein
MKLDNSVVANLLNTLQNINKDNIILTPEELLNLIKAIKKTYSKKNYRNVNVNVDVDDSDLTQMFNDLNKKIKCNLSTVGGSDEFKHPDNLDDFIKDIKQIVKLSFKNKETEKVFGIGKKDDVNFKYNKKPTGFTEIQLKNLKNSNNEYGMEDFDIDYNKSIEYPEETIKRKFNDKITEFCTNNFFKNKKSRLLYIDLINKTFITMLYEILNEGGKNKIKLVLKGGVALRLVVQELFRDFYGEITDDLLKEFKKEFKISDFDFELFSLDDFNSNTPDNIKFKNQLDICTYLVMIRLQSYLNDNKDYYFDFFKYNEEVQKKEYKKLLDNINKDLKSIDSIYEKYEVKGIEPGDRDSFCLLSSFSNEFTDTDQDKSVYDSFIIANFNKFFESYFTGEEYNEMDKLVKYNPSSFYSTHNTLITFKSGKNQIAFSLNRIKFCFKATFRNKSTNEEIVSNMVGEILDLSHAWPHDRHNYMKEKLLNENTFLKNYKLSNSNYEFISYSYKGFITDLIDILFTETDFMPWKDIKYSKRLNRLIILTLFMYTQKDLIGDEYKSFVSRIKLFDDIKELINNDFNNNDLINQIEKVDNNCGVLSTVIDNLKNIASKNNKQNDEYKEYKENISNIFNKIICTLIQHWEKTREPFLTNSNIDTGILNIDFYHLYE